MGKRTLNFTTLNHGSETTSGHDGFNNAGCTENKQQEIICSSTNTISHPQRTAFRNELLTRDPQKSLLDASVSYDSLPSLSLFSPPSPSSVFLTSQRRTTYPRSSS